MKRNRDLPQKLLSHPWTVSLKRAAAIQTELAQYVSLTPLAGEPELIGGVDSAYRDNTVYVAAVLIDMSSARIVDIQYGHATDKQPFPYAPGYLAFREAPAMLKVIRRLRHRPDLLFVAGHGVCHPRLCGIASHIGLRASLPTIGCARERLVGHYQPPGAKTGDYSTVRYSPHAEGVVLRSREGVKPIFISPGHRIDLLGAIAQTMRCLTKYRIPEPLRRAHIEAGKYMRSQRDES
ncbi:MAG TPA: endonuclease V [candidate division Zixibacteria bacterium]|nr:endonuclease V [candidate division Zixibacteria bacterium]